MRVNFAIVSLFNAEHEVDTSTLEVVTLFFIILAIKIEIPCRHLEAVKKIGGNIFWLDTWVDDVTHLLHFEFIVSAHLHKALLEQHLLVEESLITGHDLKALWDTLVAIANDDNEEVVLGELRAFIHLHAVVIVKATLESVL